MDVPTLYHLKIENFRGLKTLSWHPTAGVNLILGGGDVGKTTILEAIALLLSPSNSSILPDTDYYARDEQAGFSIEGVMGLPTSTGISDQIKPSWPWDWNGKEVIVPSTARDEKEEANNKPVYRFRVRATPDLELFYEIIRPDGETDSLPVTLRRAIGLVRLGGDDRNDRDLRLVQGSALDRLLSDKSLRSRLASELAKTEVKSELTEAAKKTLEALDAAFKEKTLPADLDLSITGGQGMSVAALIGLTARRDNIQLPLSSWGAGTRRIAALTIAEQNQGEAPITLVDEIERGLEPYRQRTLMDELQAGKSQAFITTHSPSAISASSSASLWYIDHAGKIGALDREKTKRHRKNDPEAFLSRITIVAEGLSEQGFATVVLERAFDAPLTAHGIHITDGGGHDSALDVLEVLAKAGLQFGGFADDEGKYPTRWQDIAMRVGHLLFRWDSGHLETNIIGAIPDDKFPQLLSHPDHHKTGKRLRTLADRMDCGDKDFETIKAKSGSGLRALIIEAASGTVHGDRPERKKEFKGHGQDWFKTYDGGRELAEKMFTLGIWSAFKPRFILFCNAVRGAVGLPEILDIRCE
jgi:putative ATP-dependent endonuclease of OLD family